MYEAARAATVIRYFATLCGSLLCAAACIFLAAVTGQPLWALPVLLCGPAAFIAYVKLLEITVA